MADILPTTKNILIVAGDPSGDLHGAGLIKALKKIDPEISVAALGGKRMQEVSDRFIYNLVSLGAAGFAEPLRRLFLWIRLIALVRRYLDEKRPACVVSIDFYGFNHQVLGLAAHRKIPAFYYISPQVWASRPARAQHLARLVRHMIVILPFEEELYRKIGAGCTFVGHPLLDILPEPAKPQVRPPDYQWKIGLLPGSRPQEIARHMPVFWKAFLQVRDVFPKAKAYIFAAPEIPDEMILSACRPAGTPDFEIVRESNYEHRAQLDIAITSSGTATLENALLGVPMAVVYKLPWFTYQVAKHVIKIPYISLVNILVKKPLVKEYIQNAAVPEAISGQIMGLLQNPDRLAAMRSELLALRKMLGAPGAAAKAAEIIASKTFSTR